MATYYLRHKLNCPLPTGVVDFREQFGIVFRRTGMAATTYNFALLTDTGERLL